MCAVRQWRRAWQPTPVFLPGESHGQRRLAGYSPWGRKESDVTEWLSTAVRQREEKCFSYIQKKNVSFWGLLEKIYHQFPTGNFLVTCLGISRKLPMKTTPIAKEPSTCSTWNLVNFTQKVKKLSYRLKIYITTNNKYHFMSTCYVSRTYHSLHHQIVLEKLHFRDEKTRVLTSNNVFSHLNTISIRAYIV